jgi:hypothetical protein
MLIKQIGLESLSILIQVFQCFGKLIIFLLEGQGVSFKIFLNFADNGGKFLFALNHCDLHLRIGHRNVCLPSIII